MEFLFNLSEEWTPIRDIPQTKLNHFHLSLLSSVGAIETEQEYDIRLLNGETQTARITNHGWREDNDRSMPVETRELIAKFLPDVDIDCEINIRAIAVRPTFSGIEIRDNPDQKSGISKLVEAINDPPPYSVGSLYVVPVKIAGRDQAGGQDITPSLTKAKKPSRLQAKPQDTETTELVDDKPPTSQLDRVPDSTAVRKVNKKPPPPWEPGGSNHPERMLAEYIDDCEDKGKRLPIGPWVRDFIRKNQGNVRWEKLMGAKTETGRLHHHRLKGRKWQSSLDDRLQGKISTEKN